MRDELRDFTTRRDHRMQIYHGYPYYICTKCGGGVFILTLPSDNIFPDAICANCGNSFQSLKEGKKNG